eukprot:IDg8668t1
MKAVNSKKSPRAGCRRLSRLTSRIWMKNAPWNLSSSATGDTLGAFASTILEICITQADDVQFVRTTESAREDSKMLIAATYASNVGTVGSLVTDAILGLSSRTSVHVFAKVVNVEEDIYSAEVALKNLNEALSNSHLSSPPLSYFADAIVADIATNILYSTISESPWADIDCTSIFVADLRREYGLRRLSYSASILELQFCFGKKGDE